MSETTQYLAPIDREGLEKFAEVGRNNPDRRGTNKIHTICVGQYRTLSYLTNPDPMHPAVVVDEPLHLFGQNTAPAPGEVVLSGALAAMFPCAAGDNFRVSIGGIGACSVRFE